MKKIDEALSIAKEIHSHSILNNDKYYTDKLLQIIINLSTIDENLLANIKSVNYEDEIIKVKRKVPKWMNKTHQYNYKILKAYMDLSIYNEISISVKELEAYSEIESKIFLAHYNNMKTISKKNHAKVFEEINKNITLWKPIANFIEELFKEKEKEKIGKFVQKEFKKLINNDMLSAEMLNNLQNSEYSKETFNIQFPILKKVTDNSNIKEEININGHARYYANPIQNYLLCNHWYENHRDDFNRWKNTLTLLT